MRPVHLTDLDAVVRAMLAVAPEFRGDLVEQIVVRAWTADCYRKRLKCRHPVFGDGTLTAAAAAWVKVPARARCDSAYLGCLCTLASILAPKERFDLQPVALYRSKTVPYEGQGHGDDKNASPQY